MAEIDLNAIATQVDAIMPDGVGFMLTVFMPGVENAFFFGNVADS
tara:strand:- start:262 stop:396 length:135 start_codon:yes stop_codon:yes gene_type:complete